MKKKRKTHPIPFNVKLSYDLDKAVVALEDGDKVRRILGKAWKRRLEKKIWGET